MLLAIDPGTDTGWALFGNAGALLACGLEVPNPDLLGSGMRVLVEVPKFRPGDPNPQSLIVLALKAGEWGGRYLQREYLTPNDWKGSTPKDVSHRRIFAKLDPTELGELVKGCKGVSPRLAPINEAIAGGLSKSDKRHNILDAIGIGLHGVGRRA